MTSLLTLEELRIEKAKEDDWQIISEILGERKLDKYLFGTIEPVNFYLIKDLQTKTMIGCFRIDSAEESIGIVKSLAIRKNSKPVGIGTYVLNVVIPKMGKDLGYKKLYFHTIRSAFKIWKRKSIFTNIDPDKVKEKCIKEYVSFLRKAIPDDFYAIFYLDLV